MWNNPQWKITGDWLFYQGCKEYPHGISIKGKIPIRSSLLNGTQKRREMMWAKLLPGEWVIWAKYWALQCWNPIPGRWTPLASWRPGETNRRAGGSLDFAREEHTCLLSPGTRWRVWIEIARGTGQFPAMAQAPQHSSQACFATQLHTREALRQPRGELHCEGKATQARSGIRAGLGGRDSITDSSQGHQNSCSNPCQASAPAPLVQALIPSRARVPVLGAGRTSA